jgi:MYXO-CTERM domain-containing protein
MTATRKTWMLIAGWLALTVGAAITNAAEIYIERFNTLDFGLWEEVWSQDINLSFEDTRHHNYLRVNYHDNLEHPNTWLRTTDPRFLGDQIAADIIDYGMSIRPDEQMEVSIAVYGIGTGWSYSFGTIEARDHWQRLWVWFDPTWTSAEATAHGWQLLSGIDPGFDAMMADVSHVTVFGSGPAGYDLDNFTNAWPSPASISLLALAGLGAARRRRRPSPVEPIVGV